MSHVFLIVSTGAGAGLTTVSLGMVRALDRLGIRSGFCKPIAQLHDGDSGPERSTQLIEHVTQLHVPTPIALKRAKAYLAQDKENILMEDILSLYQQSAKHADVVVVEGLVADSHAGYAMHLNTLIAKALDAEVILVGKPEDDLAEYVDIAARTFASANETALIGLIVNKVGASSRGQTLLADESPTTQIENFDQASQRIQSNLSKKSLHMLGLIPWERSLVAPRMCDIADHLQPEAITSGEIKQRRVQNIELCEQTVSNTLDVYQPHTLLMFSGDRDDIFVTACMAALNGVPLAGILLTGGLKPSVSVMRLCKQALHTGVPVLLSQGSSFQAVSQITRMSAEVAVNDFELIDLTMDHVASHLDLAWLETHCAIEREPRLSPTAFRYQLIQKSGEKLQTIVLPEGEEPRTIVAAHQCSEKGVARCVLLGSPSKIHHIALSQGITLGEEIEIIEPDDIRMKYIKPMVKIRAHKGLTSAVAENELQDSVVLGTMMLALGEVSGLVSGALHTTANTVRPALQLIGTSDDAKLVSSLFFMLLPDQVVVYADCAINPDPNAEQLADIAIQSADSAKHFGIEPRIAMISYSTGESGKGEDVKKFGKPQNLFVSSDLN